jgi:hypothetical protein
VTVDRQPRRWVSKGGRIKTPGGSHHRTGAPLIQGFFSRAHDFQSAYAAVIGNSFASSRAASGTDRRSAYFFAPGPRSGTGGGSKVRRFEFRTGGLLARIFLRNSKIFFWEASGRRAQKFVAKFTQGGGSCKPMRKHRWARQ